jgi:hypothetical protein
MSLRRFDYNRSIVADEFGLMKVKGDAILIPLSRF